MLDSHIGNIGEYWELDVSAAVTTNSLYSFALTSNDALPRTPFESKEDINAPYLQVTYTVPPPHRPPPATNPLPTNQDFSGGAGQTPYTLSTFGAGPGPAVSGGALVMVSELNQQTVMAAMTGGTNQQNVIAFDQTTTGIVRHIEAQWDFSITTGTDGLGFALLNMADYGTSGPGPHIDYWDKPNLTGSFGVGIDTFYYHVNRSSRWPSHEVSLHWNGWFRENALSPVDFVDGTTHTAHATIDYTTSGANISVDIDGAPVYANTFMAGMTPADCRAAFGAQTSGSSGTITLDNVHVTYQTPMTFPDAPATVHTFNKEWVYWRSQEDRNRQPQRTFVFPDIAPLYERVILRLMLDEPPGGIDHWDRKAAIYVWDASGAKIEICRYITSYRVAWKYWVDVTDYQSLLRGARQVGLYIDTWVPGGTGEDGAGYLVTVDFDFYAGVPGYAAYRIDNLWVGDPEYGNPSNPIQAFFAPKDIMIDPGALKVKLRFMVTGHGWDNTDNAAEFYRSGRTALANGMPYYNILWRDTNFLTPVQPQPGTWMTPRAGWGPGLITQPWEIDITGDVAAGTSATIEYRPDPFTRTDFNGDPATHWVESQILYYTRTAPGEKGSFVDWTRY